MDQQGGLRGEASRRYFGQPGRDYFARQDKDGVWAARFNKFLFAPFISPTDDILDFGCGGGHLLNVLEARTKIGIDINPIARESVGQKGIKAYANLEALEEGLSFDRIITSHALEHVPCPYDILVGLRKLLRPQGALVWLSPMDDWRRRLHRSWQANDFDMHLYAWTPLTIGNLLVTAGYRPQSIEIITHAFPPRFSKQLWQIHPTLFHLIGRAWAMVSNRRQIRAVATLVAGHD